MNRSLADDIRSRTDAQLRHLLVARPDLAHPAPRDLTALAARAATTASVQQAVERLDTAGLQVLDAVVTLCGSGRQVDESAVCARLGPGADSHLTRLWDMALLWRSPEGLRIVGMVPQVFTRLSRRNPASDQTLATPPALELSRPGREGIDAAAGWQARETVRLVDELAQSWAADPPSALRGGGLSVRDLATTARRLDTTPDHGAWLVELAFAAGLLAQDTAAASAPFLPTEDVDGWRTQGAHAWVRLARAWLESSRAAHLVGTTAAGRSGKRNALGLEIAWAPIVPARLEVLDVMSTVPIDAAASEASLVARLLWNRPLRDPDGWEHIVRAVLREADWLGVTARGGLSSAGRGLLAGADEAALAALAAAALPPSVEHILLQADLTAVIPGPVEGELAELLALATVVESRGGATVSRFTPESVRRTLDAGWTADVVLEALHRFSTTPVPQPLEYLVRDVARRHGQARVGRATAYLRCDDEVALTQMLADRSLGAARLRRIAPTVLVSGASPTDLLGMMRAAGYSPMQEAADGSLVVASTPRRRARASRRPPQERRPLGPDETLASALVAALRTSGPQQSALAVHVEPSTTAAILREAAGRAEPAWIGYADASGTTARSLVWVVSVEGGRVHVIDADGRTRWLPLHRVTAAALTSSPPRAGEAQG
ncbi:MAG: helicase-associated domain-containing protein [Dermatophilaceae bacterium]